MDGQEWVSAEEAAGRLGVDPRQVRRLAAQGQVPAVRAQGGAWLVDPDAIEARARRQGAVGRPLSPVTAWRTIDVLDLASHTRREWREPWLRPHQSDSASRKPDGLDAEADRRLAAWRAQVNPVTKSRILSRLRDATPGRLAAQLRSRAEPHRMWAHPGALEHLARDGRVRVGAAAAVAAQGGGVAAGGRERLYVREADLRNVLDEYGARLHPRGQVSLMVVPDEVDADVLTTSERFVPEALAWVDLLDDPDPRAAHAAAQWLRTIQADVWRDQP